MLDARNQVMGSIQRKRDETVSYLPHQLMIGRAGSSQLALDVSSVSSHHATIRWHRNRWLLTDLSSRNGTYLNGKRLASGSLNSVELKVGDEIAFAERDEVWILIDATPPQTVLIADDDSSPLPLNENSMRVLPNEQDALGYVYYSRTSWRFEDETGKVHELGNGHLISVGGRSFRLHLPGEAAETPVAEHPVMERTLSLIELDIFVAADEETSAVSAKIDGQSFEVQARTHLYLLAFLARRRVLDHQLNNDYVGWVAVDEVCEQLGLSPELLGVMVFRCRKEFEKLGFSEPLTIVDRSKKGFLRIGVDAERLSVRSI